MDNKTLTATPESQAVSKPTLDSFAAMHRDIDRMFSDMWRPWRGFGTLDVPALKGAAAGVEAAKVDVSETDTAYQVTAELPGLEETDIEVNLADGMLTLKGSHEENAEEDKPEKYYHLRERRYGSFERRLGFGDMVDADKIEAKFKNGVLTVDLKKSAEKAKAVKKIAVKG